MLDELEIIFGLLVVMVGLVAVARRLRIPYPILLVLGGLGIGFVPGLPKIELEPDLVFFLFLPPILQLAGYYTPIRDFRANLRSIGLLAIGLVLFTIVIVAVVAHIFIDGMSWPVAFLLGAIVAPPDAVAASSIAQRLKLPRRIVTVLEGESLLNDATALVAYRVAVTAVVTGAFSWTDAGLQFVVSSVGGVALGLAVGWILTPVFRHLLNDSSVYIILTFVSGFTAYFLGETFHVSGVLAVVTLGIFYVRHNTLTPDLRIQATVVWEIVVFILNGFIFILIGLQMRGISERIVDGSLGTLLFYAGLICLTLIVARIVWVFPATYLPRLPKKIRERDPFPAWQNVSVVAWTGMRGVVSLASALALPVTIENGAPFPQRDLVVFLTFSVILATLVLQGLSLPFLIRWLGVRDDGGAEHEENKAWLKAAYAGQKKLNELAVQEWVSSEMVSKLTRQYQARIKRFSARYHGEEEDGLENHFTNFQRLELELLEAELAAILKLRDEGIINDEVLRHVQQYLDLEIVRLRHND